MWSGTDNPRGFGDVPVPVRETASYRGKSGPLLVEATHSFTATHRRKTLSITSSGW